jgi:hypothetical protein
MKLYITQDSNNKQLIFSYYPDKLNLERTISIDNCYCKAIISKAIIRNTIQVEVNIGSKKYSFSLNPDNPEYVQLMNDKIEATNQIFATVDNMMNSDQLYIYVWLE